MYPKKLGGEMCPPWPPLMRLTNTLYSTPLCICAVDIRSAILQGGKWNILIAQEIIKNWLIELKTNQIAFQKLVSSKSIKSFDFLFIFSKVSYNRPNYVFRAMGTYELGNTGRQMPQWTKTSEILLPHSLLFVMMCIELYVYNSCLSGCCLAPLPTSAPEINACINYGIK